MSIIYLAVYIVFNAETIYSNFTEGGDRQIYVSLILLLLACPISLILIWIFCIPVILTKLTVITNVS